jgi:hypothetical protein
MNFPVQRIFDQAPNRPPGYIDDVLSRGTITGDTIEFDEDTYRELVEKYRGDAGGCAGCGG